MKKIYIIAIALCVAIGTLSFIKYKNSNSLYTTVIPTNAFGSGTIVPTALFNSWFASGTPTLNGIVNPADGLTFGNSPNLDFYRWSEQMFLWITSPAPSGYGCGSLVLTSPEFYDVSLTDPMTGLRKLTRRSCRSIISSEISPLLFEVKGTAVGANNLPVLFERETHQMFDIEKTVVSREGRQLVLDRNNNQVEIREIIDREGTFTFIGVSGTIIEEPRAIISESLDRRTTVQQFTIQNSGILFLSGIGSIVVPEQGQATGDVLMAQNGSLVYYNTMVNDIYAVFLTMIKNGNLPNTAKFPTSAAELTTIQNYATAHSIAILEPSTLAMEIKTSWIETTNLTNAGDYIQIKAKVPNYTLTSLNTWTRNGTKTTTLALVGMHIVGSTVGHPEMIWGSFEHKNNTPNPSYTYKNTSSATTVVPADTHLQGPWNFASNTLINGSTVFNHSHMSMSGDDITSISPFTISPSNTQRTAPYGTSPSNSTSNAQIIATNNDVISKLIGTDIRKNYFHIGTTWKAFGTGSVAGTSTLSNSTMETYSQIGNVNGDPRTNCFGCHTSTTGSPNQNMPELTFLSHVFNCTPLIP